MNNEFDVNEAKRLLALFGQPSRSVRTLPEQIANSLAEDIIRGVLKPGEPLLETVLAEQQFNVSRGPVREALRILSNEGLVEVRPRRGATVIDLSRKDIREIFEVRAVLYGFIAAELAQHHTDQIVDKLKQGTNDLITFCENNELDNFIHTLYQMSMYLAEAAGNDQVRKILFSHGRQTLSTTRLAMRNKANRSTWVANWRRIIKAIQAHDGPAAERAGRRLVDEVYIATVDMLDATTTTQAEVSMK